MIVASYDYHILVASRLLDYLNFSTYSFAMGVNGSRRTDFASKVTIAIRKPDLQSEIWIHAIYLYRRTKNDLLCIVLNNLSHKWYNIGMIVGCPNTN